MARYEATIDVGINPILDQKQFDAELRKLEKGLRAIRHGTHTDVSNRGARLINYLMSTGQAISPTQGRMILSDRMGGGFSSVARANLRTAQNQAQFMINAQRQSDLIKRRNVETYNSFLAREQYLKEDYQAYKDNPTRASGAALITKLTAFARDVKRFAEKATTNKKKLEEYARLIALNTGAMKKDITDTEKKEQTKQSFWGGAKKLSAAIFGISSFIGLLKRGYKAVQDAYNRGLEGLRSEAAYGKSVNWGDVATRSALFKMSQEAAAEPSRYAADFRQRMLWGEIGEREIIGLARAGKWGQMVLSGEAARNPAKANQAFEDLVASTNQGEMRSILRQLGFSQEAMNYNLQAYNQSTRSEYQETFSNLVESEKLIAASFFDVANQANLLGRELADAVGLLSGEVINYASPQAQAASKALKNRFGIVGSGTYLEKMKEESKKEMSLIAPAPAFSEKNGSSITLNVTNNNTINANGAGLDSADEFGNRLGGATAGAIYTDLAKVMGGRTGF